MADRYGAGVAWPSSPSGRVEAPAALGLSCVRRLWQLAGFGADSPPEGVVGDLFPSRLAEGEVTAARELAVSGDRCGVPVMMRIGPVQRWRDDMVSPARYEEQRPAIIVAKVNGGRRVGREVGQATLENDPARCWHLIAVVNGT